MDLQVLVDEAATTLGAPVTLEDRSFRLLAFSSHSEDGGEPDTVRLATVLRRGSSPQVRTWFEQFGIAHASEPVRTPASPELGVTARWCIPLRQAGITYGYFWVADLGQDDVRLALVAPLAAAAAEELAQAARTAGLIDARVRDLVGDDPRAAERAGAELVASGRLDVGLDVRVVMLARPATLPLGGNVLRTDVDGRPVLVIQRLSALPGRGASTGTDRAARAGAADWVAGVGSAVPAARAALSLEQARIALQVAQTVTSVGPLAIWDDLGPYRLLALAPAAQLRAVIEDDSIRRLLDDSTLYRTALTYLTEAGSVARAAAALHIHRQTLYHRLGRIERLTGLRLDNGDHRLRLHLGLALARALGS